MPTGQEILKQLEKNHAPAFAYVKFPKGTLPDFNKEVEIGRISRGHNETITLAPVSIVYKDGIERLRFNEPISWPGGAVDLSMIKFELHQGLEFAIFIRLWQDSKLQKSD